MPALQRVKVKKNRFLGVFPQVGLQFAVCGLQFTVSLSAPALTPAPFSPFPFLFPLPLSLPLRFIRFRFYATFTFFKRIFS